MPQVERTGAGGWLGSVCGDQSSVFCDSYVGRLLIFLLCCCKMLLLLLLLLLLSFVHRISSSASTSKDLMQTSVSCSTWPEQNGGLLRAFCAAFRSLGRLGQVFQKRSRPNEELPRERHAGQTSKIQLPLFPLFRRAVQNSPPSLLNWPPQDVAVDATPPTNPRSKTEKRKDKDMNAFVGRPRLSFGCRNNARGGACLASVYDDGPRLRRRQKAASTVPCLFACFGIYLKEENRRNTWSSLQCLHPFCGQGSASPLVACVGSANGVPRPPRQERRLRDGR